LLPFVSFQAAAQYIEQHNLQKAVEDAINATIKAKPEEPFAFMVRCRRRRQPLAAGQPPPLLACSVPQSLALQARPAADGTAARRLLL
jgi:hypothetical protein